MRIVFLNSLEKKELGEVTGSARIWMGEQDNIWQMGWNELTDDGETENIWYEGGSWSEMLHVYRHRLVVKLSEGYRPVIDGIADASLGLSEKSAATQKLYCYSEQHSDEGLYQELCGWRRKRATADRKPPYLIASNRLLRLISTFLPHTIEELKQLPGMGENKAREYGAELLDMTKNKSRSSTFPLNWVDTCVSDEMLRSWLYKQKEEKYRVEMERYRLSRSVLEGIASGWNLEQIVEATQLARRDVLEILESLDKEGYDVGLLIDKELQDMPKEEQAAVWQAYQELGDELLKPVLQRVYGPEVAESENREKLYERLRLIRIRFRHLEGRKERHAG